MLLKKRQIGDQSKNVDSKNIDENDEYKLVSDTTSVTEQINHSTETSAEESDDNKLWAVGHQNPDYKLATLNAANLDFQSKLDTTKGSYFIQNFVTIATQSLEKGNDIPFIGDIFDTIQNDLSQYKQLPEYTWNNDTRSVLFKKNYLSNVETGDGERNMTNETLAHGLYNNTEQKMEKKEKTNILLEMVTVSHNSHELEGNLSTKNKKNQESYEMSDASSDSELP
eukprot:67761_1